MRCMVLTWSSVICLSTQKNIEGNIRFCDVDLFGLFNRHVLSLPLLLPFVVLRIFPRPAQLPSLGLAVPCPALA